MKINWLEMLIYAVIIGILTAISRWWNKWIEVHWVWASLIAGILTTIWSLLYIFIVKVPFDTKQIWENFWYILIPTLSFMIIRPLVIVGFQKWFSVSTFPLLFSLLWTVFTVIIWLFFYKEIISLKQVFWIILTIAAAFLLR